VSAPEGVEELLPAVVGPIPGPLSTRALLRARTTSAPMGPARGVVSGVVYARASGSTVVDLDGNRFVDLAAGFGAELLGHSHPAVVEAISEQAGQLLHALGDLYPSDVRLELEARLLERLSLPTHQLILGQSGADAVCAALKTAVLATGRPGVVAFTGSYHGLSYAPLACLGLRPNYAEPFLAQLNGHVSFVPYPHDPLSADESLSLVRTALGSGEVGAVLIEPILGRGGCIVPPAGFMAELLSATRQASALLIADEVWTALGRAGAMLATHHEGIVPDLLCLGKGLGGGLPISACVGSEPIMRHWSREPEVMHTATFAGNPLSARTALITLEVLKSDGLVERSRVLGSVFLQQLKEATLALPGVVDVRGRGLMLAIDLGPRKGIASVAMMRLLERGFIVSTGGGAREVLVLTPALTVNESQLEALLGPLVEVILGLAP
jgi:4-aminobutyrate aminotransferase / (S)-3-amino-2-methylpropionate transaminase / 5-aminovalerate transaminase